MEKAPHGMTLKKACREYPDMESELQTLIFPEEAAIVEPSADSRRQFAVLLSDDSENETLDERWRRWLKAIDL